MAKKKIEETPEMSEQFFFQSFERGVVKTPEFKEYWRNGGQPWINFGIDNLYPQELIRLYLDASSLHTALIRKKTNMTAGNGFDKSELNGASLNFLANRFGHMTVDQIAYASSFDLSLFGGYYLAITWSKDGEQIARIAHMPYEKVRLAKPIDGDDIHEKHYYISRDWENYRRKENQPFIMPSYNPLMAKEEPTQLLFIKQYSPNAEYYSYSPYTSTLNWIKLAYEINVFHLKSVQNNMNSGLIIVNKAGIPPKEMREQQYQELKRRYAGADASGDILMVYAENAEKAPEFIPFPNNGSDQRFKDLTETVNTNIRLGHDASSIVAGLEVSGKLGNSTEILDAYDMYQNTVITPYQTIIQDSINKLAAFNGITTEFKLNKFNALTIKDAVVNENLYEIRKKD